MGGRWLASYQLKYNCHGSLFCQMRWEQVWILKAGTWAGLVGKADWVGTAQLHNPFLFQPAVIIPELVLPNQQVASVRVSLLSLLATLGSGDTGLRPSTLYCPLNVSALEMMHCDIWKHKPQDRNKHLPNWSDQISLIVQFGIHKNFMTINTTFQARLF